jgi:hypothetical protein
VVVQLFVAGCKAPDLVQISWKPQLLEVSVCDLVPKSSFDTYTWRCPVIILDSSCGFGDCLHLLVRWGTEQPMLHTGIVRVTITGKP